MILSKANDLLPSVCAKCTKKFCFMLTDSLPSSFCMKCYKEIRSNRQQWPQWSPYVPEVDIARAARKRVAPGKKHVPAAELKVDPRSDSDDDAKPWPEQSTC
jgi:hypothetical protein